MRVGSARLRVGARIRVGRTDLSLVARGERGDARQHGLVAASPQMLKVLGEVEGYARLSWPVAIHGESGAGKEGIARALHGRGPRDGGPFVAINAGGLPRELVESELFGHERGAFTGATQVHKGVFEQADGGTLFLDEIGELPLDMQARLLRVLDTGEVRRVGAESAVRVDVRVVCATHCDLRAMVGTGAFRRDLYYRLTRLVIEVPPLRHRPEDIRALSEHFLDQIAAEVGPREIDEEAMSRLLAHPWPGNARELRNVLCSAAAIAPTPVIGPWEARGGHPAHLGAGCAQRNELRRRPARRPRCPSRQPLGGCTGPRHSSLDPARSHSRRRLDAPRQGGSLAPGPHVGPRQRMTMPA